MKILFFDTETTGVPPRGTHWSSDYEHFPRIVSIAWRLNNKNGQALIEQSYLIRPNGWKISSEATEINGLTQEVLERDGMDEQRVLKHFLIDCMAADRLIGHNIYFDTSIIKASLLRLGMEPAQFVNILHKDKRFCTMHKSTGIVSSKWPKLTEIYQHLFEEEFADSHQAMADVNACSRVYYELIKRGIN